MTPNVSQSDRRALAVRRAVLSLSVYTSVADWDKPYNTDLDTRRGGGTAFVLDVLPTIPEHKGFLALTAYHVVQHAVNIRATLFENDEKKPAAPVEATLLIYHQDLDVAVIRVCTSRPKWLVPLPTGRSDDLMPNTQVEAAGFPLRDGFQVTSGSVSGRLPDRIQIDASINPGNSGGPLITSEEGSVVGVVVSGMTPDQVQNVNFCTPIADVQSVLLPSLVGVVPRNNESPVAVAPSCFNFDLESTSHSFVERHTRRACKAGALVTRVNKDSVAHRNGMRVDDVVCEIDGHAIGYKATMRVPWWKVDALQYTTLLARKRVGDTIELKFYSVSDHTVRTVRMATEENMSQFRYIDVQDRPIPHTRLGGVVVQPLTKNLFDETPALRARFGYVLKRPHLQQRSLLVVTHVDAASPFTATNQLPMYDAVVGVNDTAIEGGDLDGYAAAFDAALKSGLVILRLYAGAVLTASREDVCAWQATQERSKTRRTHAGGTGP